MVTKSGIDAKTFMDLGKDASGLVGNAGGVLGATFAGASGVLHGSDGYAHLESLALSLGVSVEHLAGMSSTVRSYRDALSSKPITSVAKFGASTLVTGTGATIAGGVVGSFIGIGPVVGALVGLAGSVATGYVTSRSTDSAVDAIAGTNTNAVASVNALSVVAENRSLGDDGNPSPLSEGEIFSIVKAQLPRGVQDMIASAAIKGDAQEFDSLSKRYSHLSLLQHKAQILCGEAYDPLLPACAQIASALTDKGLPPAILLVDNTKLPQFLERMEASRLVAQNDVNPEIADMSMERPYLPPSPTRGRTARGTA